MVHDTFDRCIADSIIIVLTQTTAMMFMLHATFEQHEEGHVHSFYTFNQ